MKIFIVLISIFAGFLCSQISNINFKYEKKSDINELIQIIREWKEIDTRR